MLWLGIILGTIGGVAACLAWWLNQKDKWW